MTNYSLRTASATLARVLKADERMAERLRKHGWAVSPPQIVGTVFEAIRQLIELGHEPTAVYAVAGAMYAEFQIEIGNMCYVTWDEFGDMKRRLRDHATRGDRSATPTVTVGTRTKTVLQLMKEGWYDADIRYVTDDVLGPKRDGELRMVTVAELGLMRIRLRERELLRAQGGVPPT